MSRAAQRSPVPYKRDYQEQVTETRPGANSLGILSRGHRYAACRTFTYTRSRWILLYSAYWTRLTNFSGTHQRTWVVLRTLGRSLRGWCLFWLIYFRLRRCRLSLQILTAHAVKVDVERCPSRLSV